MSAARLEYLIDIFENAPLSNSKAAVVHMIGAGLYKLQGNLDPAIKKLEYAAKIAPNHVFVRQNLEAWLTERNSRGRSIQVALSATQLAAAYQIVLNQDALQQIGWQEMRRAALALPIDRMLSSLC